MFSFQDDLECLQRLTWLRGQRTNNRTVFPALKNNLAAGYKGPVKKELLKGAGQLSSQGFLGKSRDPGNEAGVKGPINHFHSEIT